MVNKAITDTSYWEMDSQIKNHPFRKGYFLVRLERFKYVSLPTFKEKIIIVVSTTDRITAVHQDFNSVYGLDTYVSYFCHEQFCYFYCLLKVQMLNSPLE